MIVKYFFFITSIFFFKLNCKYFTQTLRIRTYSLWTVRSVECSCMCTQWQLQMGQILRRGQKKILFRCTLLSWQRFAHVSANTWFRQLFFNEQCCFTVQVFVNGFGLKWDATVCRSRKVWAQSLKNLQVTYFSFLTTLQQAPFSISKKVLQNLHGM